MTTTVMLSFAKPTYRLSVRCLDFLFPVAFEVFFVPAHFILFLYWLLAVNNFPSV